MTACWEPIIDVATFERVGVLLTKNRHHKRTHGANRFPYILSGFVFCEQCGGRMSGKSAHGQAGKVGYYEHIKTARLQSGSTEKLKTHNPHRVPSIKLEPIVWQEVKKFILSDAFANDLLDRARLLQESNAQSDEPKKLRQKLKLTQSQIEVLAERIGSLPKEMDLKPLIDQLSKLQKSELELETAVQQKENEKSDQDDLIDFENLMIFRKGLKELVSKAEADKNVQTAVVKKVVHKIIIKPAGFEIYFHVGKSHCVRGPGAEALGSRIFFKNQSSSLLTIGDPEPPTGNVAKVT